MNYDEIRNKIFTKLKTSGLDACVRALTDITMDMYVDVEPAGEILSYNFYEDKEVSGGDLVENIGSALLEGGLSIRELLDEHQC